MGCIMRAPGHPWALCGEDALAGSITKAKAKKNPPSDTCEHCLRILEEI